MVLTTYAREKAALRLGSDDLKLGSGYIAIGSASGAKAVTTISLLGEVDRNQVAGGSVDFATAQEMGMTVNFTSVELSGLTIREFGAFAESGGGAGSAWFLTNITDTAFTGNEELQIQLVFKTF